MKPVQVLGCCGLLAGYFSMVGGFTGAVAYIGIGSLIMTAGNLYAMLKE